MRAGPGHQYPTVRQYMTAAPSTVPRNQSVSVAHRIMREPASAHLPVMDGPAVAGILTERDMLLVESLPGVEPHRTCAWRRRWSPILTR